MKWTPTIIGAQKGERGWTRPGPICARLLKEGRLETGPGRFRQAGRAFLVRRIISGIETEGEPRKAKRLRTGPFSKPFK